MTRRLAIATACLAVCAPRPTAQSNASVRFVAEDGSKIQFNRAQGLFEMPGGPGWIRSPAPFGDFVLAFDLRAITADSRPELMLRAAYGSNTNGPLQGYRIALRQQTGAQQGRWLMGSPRDVTVVEERPIEPAALDQWQHVVVSAIGPRLTVSIDGTRVAAYDVQERAGHLIFANRKGLAHLRNVQIEQVPPAVRNPSTPMPLTNVVQAGGRPPRLLEEVKPSYTREALGHAIQGVVLLNAIVLEDGSVGDVQVTRSLDPGLDVMAIGALQRWKFAPAYLNGAPVAVIVEVSMSFRLK